MALGTLKEAIAILGARQGDMTRMTRDWVEINSYTENVAGVNHVGELLRGAFALPSLRLEIKPSARFGDHLIWRTGAADELDAAPILLVGHHDTVFPPGHFEGWREEEGRAIGPGALDMKGGLAMVRAVLAALEETHALERLPLVIVSVSDEEVGSPDSQAHLATVARRAQCALVFESGRTGDAIVTRRRGTGAMTCTASGKAAHAGNAHGEGRNAIWALARFVCAAQMLTDYTRGRTVNVGLISGGTSKNTVPADASCVLDLRFESEEDATRLVAELFAVAKSAELPGTSLHLDGGVRRLPLERTAASAALYAEYAACQRAAGLGDSEAPLVGGGSDANTVAPLGVPAIDGLGPRGACFHTTKEYVELESYLPKAEALLRFLWGRLPP